MEHTSQQMRQLKQWYIISFVDFERTVFDCEIFCQIENNVWKSNEGDYFKQLADCNWILVKKNKIHRWFDSVLTKTDPVEGQFISLKGGNINYKIYEHKVVIVDLANAQAAPNVWHGGWTQRKIYSNSAYWYQFIYHLFICSQ